MYPLLLAGWTTLALSIVAWLILLPLTRETHDAADVRYQRWLSRLRLLTLLLPCFLMALHAIVVRSARGAAPAVSETLASGLEASPLAPVARIALLCIGCVWLAGCLFALLRFMRAWFVERSLLRGSLASGRVVRERLRVARERLDIDEPVELRVAAVDSPMVVGRSRATILVPAFAWSANDVHTDALLLHELAHVRRHDSRSNLWVAAASILYWWHPTVRRAVAHARCEREFACDDLAASALGSRSALAHALVGLADIRQRAHSGILRLAADAHPLVERVQRLVAVPCSPRNRAPATVKPHMTGVAFVLAAGVCVAAITMISANTALGRAYARSWLAPSQRITFSAQDAVGPFSLVMRKGRVESFVINRVPVPLAQIAMRGDSVTVHDASGARVLSLAVDPRGAIAWTARRLPATSR